MPSIAAQGPQVFYDDLGVMPYQEAWNLQEQFFKQITTIKLAQRKGELSHAGVPQFLFSVQHPPVYTIGKSGKMEHLLMSEAEMTAAGIAFHKINRGGDITFHGLGQLVIYPLLDLDQFYTDIHRYLRELEEAVILTLAEYDIVATRFDKLTGVWVGNEKICAMGVRASHWVTMHGLALNVNTELGYFNHIVPCGIADEDKSVTSMAKLLGQPVDLEGVKSKLLKHLSQIFGFQLLPIDGYHPHGE